MNSKLLDYKLTFTLSILMMYPGVAFLLVSNHRFEKFLVFTLAVLIGGFLFYQSYNIFKSVQGFLKRFFISTFLVSGSLCIVAVTPEAKNASAGAFLFLFIPSLFLFIPSLFISIYLLYKSKPALKVKALYKRAYKPLKQDK